MSARTGETKKITQSIQLGKTKPKYSQPQAALHHNSLMLTTKKDLRASMLSLMLLPYNGRTDMPRVSAMAAHFGKQGEEIIGQVFFDSVCHSVNPWRQSVTVANGL